MTESDLGMKWESRPGGPEPVEFYSLQTNTRTALWPGRWPAIALQECIDIVEAAEPADRAEVKFALPCKTCPENTACLNAKRKELGPLLYDREILTLPRSSESSLFPREMFVPMLNAALSCVRAWIPPFSLEHDYKICQAWDLAWSEKTGGDYLTCITAYVHIPSGRRVILDIERWQRLTFDEQCTMIEAKWRQFGADLVVIEGDAAQMIWTQHMAATTPVPVIRHDAGGKRDLSSGVPGLLLQFENRKYEFPFKQGAYHHEEVENLLNEFEAFGWVDGKLEGVGEHDDAVMCFWHLNWGIDRLTKFDGGGREMHRGVVPGARQ